MPGPADAPDTAPAPAGGGSAAPAAPPGHNAGPRPRPGPAPLWVLALCVIGGTLAMHIFVPALPAAAQGLGASVAEMQASVSVYIAGLAVGQLIYGPVSDHFGRRPTLIAGLALYTLAGLACALAPNAPVLIVARLAQALGGCAGLVLGRAIVRDTSSAEESARRLAMMNLMVTLGPAIAPLLGAGLAGAAGWRAIFWGLATLGATALAFAWRRVPETRPEHQRPADTAAQVHGLLVDAGGLLKDARFMGYAVGGGCATTAMYAFIAAAPFVLVQQLHRPVGEVGFTVALLASGVWLGNVVTSRLVRRVPLQRLLQWANGLSLAAAATLLAGVLGGALVGAGGLALVVGTMFGFTIGVGMASSAAVSQAIGVNPRVVGSASGLYGFIQMGIGAGCTALAALGGNPALSAATVLTGAALVGMGAFWMARRAAAAAAMR